MKINQFDVWIADLNPRIGSEPGETRPVVVIQTNLLNKIPHPSTIVCPITSNVNQEAKILRVHLEPGMANLNDSSDIMMDQLRAIDNRRLVRKLGQIPAQLRDEVNANLKVVMELG